MRGEVGRGGALSPVARDEERHAGQALAQGRSLLGVSAAHDRADGAVAPVAHGGAAPLRHEVGHLVVHRAAGLQQQVLDLGRAGVGGLHQDVGALALLAAALEERLQAVGAEIGVHRDRVGPGHVQVRLGVRLGRAADVAALDVGDDQKAQWLWAKATVCPRRGRSRAAPRASK